MAITHTVTVPTPVDDRVQRLRAEALHNLDRIVAIGGVPLILWAAGATWSENRTLSVAAAISAVVIALPVAIPSGSLALQRISPVAGLAVVSVLSWLLNGAASMTGFLMWSTAIIAAIAIGFRTALAIVVGSCLLLLSDAVANGEWVLPVASRATNPQVLTRFVLAFAILTVTILSVAWRAITPLEHSLEVATDLVRALRQEQRARAALDLRLTHTDQETRVGIARHLRRHLRTSLAGIERSLANAAARGAEVESAAVDKAVVAVGQLIDHVRAASRQLRPVLLDDAGLAPALESLAQSELGANGITYDLELGLEHRRLADGVEMACYRIVQEAINNIVQHGQATHARLRVACDARQVQFAIEDNGVGFDPREIKTDQSGGVGLFGMRRRSDALGGTLRIESARGRGTRIHFTFPLTSSA